jgi:Fic family protein
MASWSADTPFNDLPNLPPAAELEDTSTLKLVIEARDALVRVDQALETMVNPSVLINAIPLLEAQASSEVENIVTTADTLFQFAQYEEAADPATREALRYRSALFAGFSAVRERGIVTTNTARNICSEIKGHTADLRRGTGTYIGNPATRQPVYTPPEGYSVLNSKLGNWETFMNGNKQLDPLVKMAVGHYQFEAIHPFEDGNGRTGRILNVLHLVADDLLRLPVLYLSKYIIGNKEDYYRLLRAVSSDGSWTDWIHYMLDGVRSTSRWTLERITTSQNLFQATRAELETAFGTVDAGLLDVLFEQPYCRISNVQDRCRVSRPTATKMLNRLVEEGILQDFRVGRDRIFVNHRFMDVLTGH